MPQAARIVAIEALGVAIDLSISGSRAAEAAGLVERAWGGARRAGGEPLQVLRLCAGEADRSADLTTDDLDLLLHQLSQLVTRAAIEARAGELMMLHAAGLANPVTGATVALVAPSGTGKTTVCAELGHRFAYVSDETVGFDASLAVRAYRKPLSVRGDAGLMKAQVSPIDAGLELAPDQLSLAAVVLLERDDAATTVDVEGVRTVVALPLLAEQTSYLARHARPLGFLADALERTGGLRVVRYRSANELAPLVGELTGVSR